MFHRASETRTPESMKRSLVSLLAVAGMVLTPAGLAAQQQGGESTLLDAASRSLAVESVASTVEQRYPWPDTARMIADHVRARHASRAYDTIPTLRDLARALTRDLRAINGDLHLIAMAGSPMGPGGAGGSGGVRTGIERVERLDGNVGYLKLSLIAGTSAFDAVAQALRSLDGTDAMILDLRAVPGGTAPMSDFIVSHFLPPDIQLISGFSPATGETFHRHTLREVPGPRRLDVPLYVLVDRGTASAGEAVPFVLQNLGRATIVGERTAGAGRMVSFFPAALGLSVGLSTTQMFEESSGRQFERTGVVPDIATTSADALTAALEHAHETMRATQQPAAAGPADLDDRYRAYAPQGEVRGVLVLLPGYGGNPASFDPTSAQSPSTLPARLAERGVLTIVAVPESQTLYESEEAVRALDALLAQALPLHGASGRPLAIGGFSAGGTGAVRYAQYCAQRKCRAVSGVSGVFAVDAPLDFERLYRSALLSTERAAPRTFVAEDHMIVQTLREALGGTPAEARGEYRLHSAVLASAADGGNAPLLADIPIRLYSEPDVQWWIQERNLDYYALNSIDHATLINLLRIAGNARAELITTTGRGVRPNGQRHPHAWSIVDETDLLHWLLGLLES
jgi:acetyl esterase/lipase